MYGKDMNSAPQIVPHGKKYLRSKYSFTKKEGKFCDVLRFLISSQTLNEYTVYINHYMIYEILNNNKIKKEDIFFQKCFTTHLILYNKIIALT